MRPLTNARSPAICWVHTKTSLFTVYSGQWPARRRPTRWRRANVMGIAAQVCTLKDWAALISAVAWPFLIAFVLVFFKTALASWLSRVTNAELLGVKLTS